MSTTVTRADLQRLEGMTPKLLKALESLFVDTANNTDAVSGIVGSTGALQNATVVTLSPNAAFANERVLVLDPAWFSTTDAGGGGNFTVTIINVAATNGGYPCTFNLEADTSLDLPTDGRVPSSAVGPYADDAAAAAAGVGVGEWYAKVGGTVAWRVA